MPNTTDLDLKQIYILRIYCGRRGRAALIFCFFVFLLLSCSSGTVWIKSQTVRLFIDKHYYSPSSLINDYSSNLQVYERFIFKYDGYSKEIDVSINNGKVILGGASGSMLLTDIAIRVTGDQEGLVDGELHFEGGRVLKAHAVLSSRECAQSVYLSAVIKGAAISGKEGDPEMPKRACMVFRFKEFIYPDFKFYFDVFSVSRGLNYRFYFEPIRFVTHSH